MFTIRRSVITVWLVILSLSLAAAQDKQANTPQPSTLTITALRMTTDERVRIGTDNSETMFDVATAIRERGGPDFSDVTALPSAGRSGRLNRSGIVAAPSATGTGTLNFIAKWRETGGAGLLGDSGLFEAANGFIGIGTQTPPHPFSVRRNGGTLGVHSIGELFVDRDTNKRSASLVVGTGGTLKWSFGMPSGADAFQVFDLTNNASRFFVDPANGNIGIGTTAPPRHRLDVTGDINTSTEYRINSQPVLRSFVATGSLAVGVNSSTTLLIGLGNSYFGTNAGNTNNFGTFNTIIGYEADVSRENLSNATAIGYRAQVSRNNALVLGGINGVNGATASTNVGIGTTNPNASLHVVRDTSDPAVPVAIIQSSGTQAPLSFKLGNFDVARIGVRTSGLLKIASVGRRVWSDIHFDAGNDDDDDAPDLYITRNITRQKGRVGIGTRAPKHQLTIGSPDNDLAVSAPVGIYGAGLASIFVRDTRNNVEGSFGANEDGVFLSSGRTIKIHNSGRVQMTIGDDVKITGGNVEIGELDFTPNNLKVFGRVFINPRKVPDSPIGILPHLCFFNPLAQSNGEDAGEITICGDVSSIRYKKDVRSLTLGLDLVSRLRPVNFRWKENGTADLGLIAEEVERVEPLLATRDAKGEVEGVRYDRLGVVLIKAVQEQQVQIKAQQQQLQAKDARINSLETRLASLERLVNERISTPAQRTKASRARRPATARR